MVLARAAASGRGSVLWIAEDPDAWPPGLARFGLSPADLVLVQVRRPLDGLWAMEESLRCPGVAGALLMLRDLDPTAAGGCNWRPRRAVRSACCCGRMRRMPGLRRRSPAGGSARWPAAAARYLGDPRWQLDLLRCRGGRPGGWQVTWRPAAEELDVEDAAEIAVVEAPARAAGAMRRRFCRQPRLSQPRISHERRQFFLLNRNEMALLFACRTGYPPCISLMRSSPACAATRPSKAAPSGPSIGSSCCSPSWRASAAPCSTRRSSPTS